MQLIKCSLLIVTLFTLPMATAASVDLTTLKRQFLDKTDLRESEVVKLSGDSECLGGDVYVLEIDEHRSLTLMMGARPLITAIGVLNAAYSERNCLTNKTTTFGDRRIDATTNETCTRTDKNGRKVSDRIDNTITVLVTGAGLEYTQKIVRNGVAAPDRLCRYRWSAGEE